MTDTNKLKELAEIASKATPGPWWIDSHGHHMVSESQDHRTIFLTNDGMGPATRHPETGNLSHWPNDWDASYIASADPTTILELIAEVERLKAESEALRKQLEQMHPFKFASQTEGPELRCAACGDYHYGLPPNMPCPKNAAIAQDAALEGGGR
ncbi:ead/Ea22-like family protein [Pseudomonas citronellolis]|uniref:ead/Ea22-like family protein n=1 Tax=Pseudomonas citronellolis TaxID=53408 RepID=UPI0021BEE7FF|nr:ead/Ea22-like family protein [Pseudomonas citronellolis]UXJ54844.1 ead/Ea22-like family protein [Pseudomonas citronellolis]